MEDTNTGDRVPWWAQQIKAQFESGVANLFILHGNVDDVANFNGAYLSLHDFIDAWLKDCEIVVYYDVGAGVRFSNPTVEASFRRASGFDWTDLTTQQEAELARMQMERSVVPLPSEPGKVLVLLERAATSLRSCGEAHKRLAIVIDHAETVVPAGDISSLGAEDRKNVVTMRRWASNSDPQATNCLALLITHNVLDLHESLRSPSCNSKVYALPLPSQEERLTFIKRALVGMKVQAEMSHQTLANLTGGLSLVHIDRTLRYAIHEGLPISVDLVKEEKKKTIISQQASSLIQILEPRFGLDTLGGMERVKSFFQEIIDAIVGGEARLVPLGVALIGPPGTGKTALAEALAYECGFAFVKIVNPREKWVGQSERNFAKALDVIRSLAPVVVLEDEADQSDTSRDDPSGDSGVANRLRQMRFSFTSDTGLRGKVLWVKITNRPDKLDAADMRSGRSSERVPLVLPDSQEKKEIFAVMPRKHTFECSVNDFSEIVKACEKKHGQCISGADIEEISLRAFRRVWRRGQGQVEESDFLWAVDDFIPSCAEETTRLQELLAIRSCSSRALIPERYIGAIDA